jgi:hypothetical protein
MMSRSWQGDKALRIDMKRTECEANVGGGGPGQSYGRCRPRHSRAGIDKDDYRFALDDRTEAHLPAGRSVEGSTLNA